jgi:NAD(P)-dependent dehydrogenase (short-subunit alcohol dehydrogenase family)
MDLNIRGKYALITGGANGIGESISTQLALEGVNIYVTSRKKKSIIELRKKLSKFNIKVDGVVIDFLKKSWIFKIRKFLKNKRLDILVNNAGHNLNITNPYCDMKEWKRIFDINFYNSVQLCNLIIPKMKKYNWGRIVNITSCAGLENMGPITYGVAKAALTAYTRTMGRILATECKNLVMSAVFPGVVITKGGHWEKVIKIDPRRAKIYLKERTPLRRFGKTNEISNVVVFYCSDLASFSHGAIVPVDGGQSRHYMYFNYL